MKLTSYRVTWEIDVEAPTTLEAAREAFRLMQGPDTTATVFSVRESRKGARPVQVDLQDFQDKTP